MTKAHIFSGGSRFGCMAMEPGRTGKPSAALGAASGRNETARFVRWPGIGVPACPVTGALRRSDVPEKRGSGPARRRAGCSGALPPRHACSRSRAVLASPAAPALPDRHGASFRMRIHHLAKVRSNRSLVTFAAPDGDRWRWRTRLRRHGGLHIAETAVALDRDGRDAGRCRIRAGASPIGAARSSDDRKAPGHGRTAHRRSRHGRGEARQRPRAQSLSGSTGAWRVASGAASPSCGEADRRTVRQRRTGRQSRCE